MYLVFSTFRLDFETCRVDGVLLGHFGPSVRRPRIQKLIFLAPSKCPIDIFGPVPN